MVRCIRALIGSRRGWIVVLMACTLAVRLAVPTGFMPAVERGRIVLQLCAKTVPAPMTAMAMPGMDHGKPDQGDHGKVEMPCAFASLSPVAIESADAALLVAAILFAFLLAARAVALVLPAPPERLRPPLRAPPRTA